MDPSTAVIIGFAAQTLLIAGLFWQVNSRMDRLATKDDVANLENRTKERINDVQEQVNDVKKQVGQLARIVNHNREQINDVKKQVGDVKKQVGQLAWIVNNNRERLILIQGHLGIGLTVAPSVEAAPTEAQPVEAAPEGILVSDQRG